MVRLLFIAVACSAAAPAGGQDVTVLTGGQAEQWRFVAQGPWAEHLTHGPDSLVAARTYYYKALTGYPVRFRGLNDEPARLNTRVVDLDRERPKLDLAGEKLVILDDVRAEAFAPYQAAVRAYVEGGGKLLVIAGRHMLGGCETQKTEVPTLPNELLFDAPPAGPRQEVPGRRFTTTSTWRRTPLEAILPVRIVSQPDLVVYDRSRTAGQPGQGARALEIRGVAADSFLAGFPLASWRLCGYHKVAAKPGAEVLARIGPERDPLLVRGKAGKGEVLVFTGSELEGAIRCNGPAGASTLVSPDTDHEVLLWQFAPLLWAAAARSLLGDLTLVGLDVPEKVTVGQDCRVRVRGTERLPRTARLMVFAGPAGEMEPRVWSPADEPDAAPSAPRALRTALLREGRHGVLLFAADAGRTCAVAAACVEVVPAAGVRVKRPERWTVQQGTSLALGFELTSRQALKDVAATFRLTMPDGGRELAAVERRLGDVPGGQAVPAPVSLAGLPAEGPYMLLAEFRAEGKLISRVAQPVAVRASPGTPELFMMIAGDRPSWPVLWDLADHRAVMTVQDGSLERSLPYMETFGGLPRAWTGFGIAKALGEAARPRDWRGRPTGEVSWASDAARKLRDERLRRRAALLTGRLVNPVLLLDDEPLVPMTGGWEAAAEFKRRSGLDAPVPERRFDDAAYLDRWTKWEDFRVGLWEDWYASATKAVQSVAPGLRTAVVVEGMGKDIHAGFDPARSQRGVDVYWLHVYPLNEPLMMIGHAAGRGTSAMRTWPRRRETWAMLQNWADPSQVPHVPPAEYIRNQYWMAVAHGVQAVGYWPYACGWWIAPGTDGWEEMGAIALRQEWLMPLLRELTAARQPIGLLYSTSQGGLDHLKGLLAETARQGAEPWHNWHANEEAYYALKTAGLPFEVLEESELIAAKGALPHRAIVLARVEYLRPEAREALVAFAKGGGKVLADESTTLKLPGLGRLATRFDTLFERIFPADASQRNRHKHREYYRPIIEGHVAKVRPALAELDDGLVRVDGEAVWNVREGGAARYLFVVNNAVRTPDIDQYAETIRGLRLTPTVWPETQTIISVRHAGAVWDALAGEPVAAVRQGERQTWQAKLDPGGAKVYVLLPERPAAIRIDAPASVKQGSPLGFAATLLDGSGKPFGAALPMRAELKGCELATRFATDPAGRGLATLFVGADLAPGRYELDLTETVTGLKHTVPVEVQAADLRLLNVP